MANFNWYAEKAAMRATLNSCIRQGFTVSETKMAIKAQFSAACNACCIANLGRTVCTSDKVCFLEQAKDIYIRVATEKCIPDPIEDVVYDDDDDDPEEVENDEKYE